MRRFLSILATVPTIVCSPALAAWSTFKDPGQNFTFKAPTKVLITHGQGVSQSGKIIPSITYGSDEGLVAMAVIDAQITAQPLISKVLSPSQVLDQDVANMQQGMGAKASSVQTEMLDGQEGRRVDIESPDGTIWTFRSFVFRGHLYTAFSGYKPGAGDKLKADAVRFHESFHRSVSSGSE